MTPIMDREQAMSLAFSLLAHSWELCCPYQLSQAPPATLSLSSGCLRLPLLSIGLVTRTCRHLLKSRPTITASRACYQIDRGNTYNYIGHRSATPATPIKRAGSWASLNISLPNSSPHGNTFLRHNLFLLGPRIP